MASLGQIELGQWIWLANRPLGVSNQHKDNVLHYDEDVDAARIAARLDVSRSVPGSVFFHEPLALLHDGPASGDFLRGLVTQDENWANIVTSLIEADVHFCPSNVHLDLPLDDSRYSPDKIRIVQLLAETSDIAMEFEE